MSEKLEKFIRVNRIEFDGHEPPAGLWGRIEDQLHEQRSVKPLKDRVVPLGLVLKIAATIVLVAAAGILFLNKGQKTTVDISKINPVMAKMQVQYASMIGERQQELKRIEKEDPYLYSEFSSEIKKMDNSYQRLKSDLPTSPNQEETVKAMIRNLQEQLGVLNQQLTIIQQINQIKKGNSNEKHLI